MAADELHDTMGDQFGGAVLRGAWFALAKSGCFEFGLKRSGNALDVTALSYMTGVSKLARIAGHERFVEAKTQVAATGQWRINELGE